VLLAAIAPVLAAASLPPATSPLPDAIDRGLAQLHQGLYDRADELFAAAAHDHPDDPEPLLFLAFSQWWRIVFEERQRPGNDDPFDAALDRVLDLGSRRIDASGDDPDPRLLTDVGTAHMLRAHVEAMRRNYFRAAQEARRGKKLLERALRTRPDLTEALFTLGAYNYYADKVPALVKGLRAILFLPGGDAKRGLEQLHAVATGTGRFRTDARLLLAVICGVQEEGCYDAALRHLRAALDDNPGSPLVLAPIGELSMRLGRYDEAIAAYSEALRRADGPEEDRVHQRAWLRAALAGALAADWRLEEAGTVLQQANASLDGAPESVRKATVRLGRELALRRGDPRAWALQEGPAAGDDATPPPAAAPSNTRSLQPQIEAALRAGAAGDSGASLALLQDAARAHPDSGLARFLIGRALFLAGQERAALPELAAAGRLVRKAPAWMEGWMELYRGLALRRLGDEARARDALRRAGAVRRFRSADRAVLELNQGREGNPRCAP
jgi:tetratricopeptide (TPR) repeat protein